MLGFSSCTETWDDNPTLKGHEGSPVVEFLNPPVMASTAISLTEEDKSGHLHLTGSQPDFGYAAAAVYEVQVSLDENFTTLRTLSTTFSNLSEINPVNSEVATAFSEMLDTKDLPTPFKPLYVRLRAYVPQSPDNTQYYSNTVKFDQVRVTYLAVILPDEPSGLFLRGEWNGWGANPEAEFLTTSEAGKYYLNNVVMTAGQGFKVADGDWGPVNLGSTGDFAIGKPYTMVNDSNSGNITCPVDFNGSAYLTLKNGVYTLLFEQN